MANEEIILQIKALMDTGDVSGAVKELQSAFNRLKLTDNIKGDFDKVFKDLVKSAEAFENKAKGSFESAADVNALKKSRKEFDNLLDGMLKSLKKLSTRDMEDIFQFDLSGIKNLVQQIEQLQKKAKESAAAAIDIQKVEKTLKDLKSMTSKTGGFDLLADLKSGDIDSAITKFEKLQDTLKGFAKGSDIAQGAVNDFLSALKAGDIEKINSTLEILTSKIGEIGKGKNGNLLFFADGLKDIALEIQKATEEAKEFKEQIKALETDKIENIGSQSREGAAGIERMSEAIQEAKGGFKQLGDNAEKVAQDTRNLNKEINELGQRASYFLSLENSVDLFRQGVRKAIETVKELDKAMTETAVVTDFSIGDMWDKLPQYTKMANELGVATQGVYEASTLYYQQGLKTEQVMALTNETLKMARIAGLECADATDLMTAALRGFNMEINEANAQRVNDVYSELAAITAADTNEIATAMTKTASIASSANMELETTAALLAQMIETTREPAETAGTAMKTIVARFTEMKKAVGDVVTVDGEEVNVNKVEAALKSAGVALRDVNGEFRDNDDVLLELASKWDSLDIMTQRYIATTAAGSRQQSRFIAMMQDYDRTVELVNAAYNSAGSSSQQFAKTQESLESKLARLENAWNTFLMGIADDKIIKSFVEALTKLMEGFNKATENADGLGGSMVRLIAVFTGLRVVKAGIDKLLRSFVGLKEGAKSLSILEGVGQRITNFKMGKGFVVDADINTKGVSAKIENLKTNWSSVWSSAKTAPVASNMISEFTQLENGMVQLGITSAATGEIMTVQLSESSAAALMAGKSADEFGKEIKENGMEATTAYDLLQKELAETIAALEVAKAKQQELNAATGANTVTPSGKKKGKKAKKKAAKAQAENAKAQAENAKKITSLEQRKQGLEEGMDRFKKAGTESSGSVKNGFRAMFSSLTPILKILVPIAAVLGTIAATAAIIYNTSPLKAAKNDTEASRGALEDYNRALEETKEKGDALNSVLDELSGRETTFDNLIKGSVEWYEAINQSNEELLKQIELLNAMGYDIGYSYDENGILQVNDEEALRKAQKKNIEKQAQLQKDKSAMSYTAEIDELREQSVTENSKNSFTTGAEKYNKAQAMSPASYTDPYAEVGEMLGYVLNDFMSADTLTEDQAVQLENLAKAKLLQTVGIYAEDDKQLKASQKVVSNMDKAYDTFYSDKAVEARLGEENRYVLDKDGNTELKINTGNGEKRDIKAEDLTEDFLKDLGYTDWNDAATSLGLSYDNTKKGVEGLYKAMEDGSKEYFKTTTHGRTDTQANWDDLMKDPSSGANIDAGFLAYKLAKNRSGTAAAKALSSSLTEDVANQVVYGTEDWVDIDTSGITDDVKLSIAESTNQANARKEEIYQSLVESTYSDGAPVFDMARDDWGNLEGQVRGAAQDIQKLEVDTNATTAAAYQAFLTSKAGKIKEDTGLDATSEQLAGIKEQYYDIFQDLDLTDATASLQTLNEKIAQGSGEAEELKTNLTAEGSSLDISNQFSDLVTSGVLDEISEDIAKLSDEAGNIDVSATRELVDSNKELKNIMDEFNVSGYAMGKILTDIQNGELSLTEITAGLVEQYKLLYSAMGQAEDVLYDLRNADLGEDYTEIGRTYEERYETAKDLYKRGAWGSENFAGNIKSLIGDKAWQSLLNKNGGSNKKAYEEAVKKYKLDKNDGNLYGSFSALMGKGAKDKKGRQIFKNLNGKITYDFTGFKNYDQILDHMVEAFGISREYAKAMLADMATYSDTLQNDLNSLNAAAAANKNYEAMYFEETESGLYSNGVIGYTSQTNTELAAVYNQTDEWESEKVQNLAQAMFETDNAGEFWEELTDEVRRQDYITEAFKKVYGIKNTVEDEEGVQRQITKIDSLGNKYYKDEEGKTKIIDPSSAQSRQLSTFARGAARGNTNRRFGGADGYYEYQSETEQWTRKDTDDTTVVPVDEDQEAILNADAVQQALKQTKATNYEDLATEAGTSAQDALEGLQEIANQPIVQQMAVELNSEEYDAWLASQYGENAPKIMLTAGFDQDSIAGISEARDEFVTKLQGIAQALEAHPITIPIKLQGANSTFKFGDEEAPINLDGFETKLIIGGQGTDAGASTSSTPLSRGTVSSDGKPKFNSTKKKEGNGYESGSDPTNGDNGGGGGDKDKRNYAEENADKQLEALDRVRETNDREAELIGKLPEEIQFPLKMMNMAEDMAYEFQEIQINRNKLDVLEADQRIMNDEAMAKGLLGEMGSAAPIYYDEMLESYMWNVDVMNSLSEGQREKAHETKDSLDELNGKIQEVKKELDGGKIQQAFLTAGKVADSFSEALKDTEKESKTLGDAFAKLGKGTILEKPLKALGDKFENLIDESKFLDKEFKGMGETLDKLPISDSLKKLVSSTLGEKAAGQLGDKGMGTALSGLFGKGGALEKMPGAETISQMMSGGTLQSLFGAMTGDMGSLLGGMGSLLNFDMMGMGLDMFNGMKDMAQKMIQYVVQFITTVINWWINREDWLYNLLSAIEQEVHNFNRQEQVEERFRLYSDEGLNDLVSAWEAMRESLEKQIDLNEQLIESRQAELQFLNLTNLPFSPAFYYDYEEERVIENPWVYDIYVLLLDLGAMIPEIGEVFSSIKQLMEDNKKRMEDGVKEIEDAREEIAELEKKQLELRTKYMEDEIELEELVMDSIIEKQQEEIDELSAMNDAITEGNEKLIETLNRNLDKIREQRENEKTEEELGEKERRLAYLRQDTSNANRKEIMDLREELEDERRDYTDELIDQKISALEEQNERAAEQRQKQIDLLQAQLDHTERYGLQWAEAQTLIKNGFDSEGRLRVGTDLFDMLMSKEDFTSMGLGSTRQVQQIMDWNVTSIAAAAFREINDIWDEGFGNFAMSNDVHDQSRLHLWADREVDYRQLPSWLSFLQPAYNTIQDYLWRTGNNIGTFAETAWGSGKNSTSILGKTIVPLLQEILGTVKGKYEEYNSLSVADGYVETTTGVITSTMENVGYDWGERMVKSLGNGFAALGDSFTEGIRAMAQSNSLNNQTSTQSIGDITVQVHIDSEDTEDGYNFGENIANAFREGLSNLSIFK